MFLLAVMPVATILLYVYIRDKYEEEPWGLLFVGVYLGLLLAPLIALTEKKIMAIMPGFSLPILKDGYNAFLVAALVEEAFKFLALYFLTMFNPELNEPFDGIVYASFISLGFAGIENFLYVRHPHLGGIQTAIYRGIFSVPGHGLFGVIMGYFFAKGKLFYKDRKRNFFYALLIPMFCHGMYNFLLLIDFSVSLLLFYGFSAFLLIIGLRQMDIHSKNSPFQSETRE